MRASSHLSQLSPYPQGPPSLFLAYCPLGLNPLLACQRPVPRCPRILQRRRRAPPAPSGRVHSASSLLFAFVVAESGITAQVFFTGGFPAC